MKDEEWRPQCPNCKIHLRCSCQACLQPEETNRPDLAFWIWETEMGQIEDTGEWIEVPLIKCNNCGHLMSEDEFLDMELDMAKYGSLAHNVII